MSKPINHHTTMHKDGSSDKLPKVLEGVWQLHHSPGHVDLQQLRSIAQTLGLLSWRCPVITIAGTNGKGSCASLLASCYSAAGYAVGCYTSPHLFRVNERIAVNQCDVTDEDLLKAFGEFENARSDGVLSFFASMTLAALIVFKQQPLDVLVLEVGLGGRLDPVNIIDPTVALITSIGLDHMDRLGGDIESIAYEKAGIMRPNIHTVYGGNEMPVAIANQAKNLCAHLHRVHHDFSMHAQSVGFIWSNERETIDGIPLTNYFKNNVACVLQVLHLLQAPLPIAVDVMRRGLRQATLPGRFEVRRCQHVPVIFDVAHNGDSVALLAEQLQEKVVFSHCYAVFSACYDKSLLALLKPLQSIVTSWFVSTLDAPRAATLSKIIAALQHIAANYREHDDLHAAFMAALQQARAHPGSCVLVYGSFKVVSALMCHVDETWW